MLKRAGERSRGKKDLGGRNREGARDCNAVAVSLLDVRVETHDEMLRAARPSKVGFVLISVEHMFLVSRCVDLFQDRAMHCLHCLHLSIGCLG